jgi:sigma-B regulation protein RsbU (phosphoserine phosphatase)
VAKKREAILANAEGELPADVVKEEKFLPTSGVLAVPMMHLAGTEDEVLVGVAILSGKANGVFDTGDEKLMGAICSQAATAIYSARMVNELKETSLMRRDMELAQQIQSTMLPESAPEVPGAEIAGRCDTAVNVGGDYFDYIINNEGAVSILLGDVTGHSLGAALMMTAARATLRSVVSEAGGPAEVIRRTNTLLHGDLDRSDLMISLFAGLYVPATRKLLYASAGHNPPLVLRRSGGDAERLEPTGIILGVLPDADYDVKYLSLEPGDVVFFYTDGVTEAMDGERRQFGEERLVNVLRENLDQPAEGIIRAVSRAVQVWMGYGKPTDDITSVVLRVLE